MFCERCGQKNNETDQFCVGCGSELKVPQNENINNVGQKVLTNNEKRQQADGYAIASLVLGIVSFIIPCIGIFTAIIGLVEAKRSNTICGVRTAGKILNIIVIIIFAIAILYKIIWPSFENAINAQWSNMQTVGE